jgi:hypothetical protein
MKGVIMDIFLPRLSAVTTQTELQRLVIAAIDKKLHFPFTPSPKLQFCTILEIRDTQGATERHGHLRILPDSAAKWFIKHSRNFKLHRRRLLSRQYFTRASDKPVNTPGLDEERRRPALKIGHVKRTLPSYINEKRFDARQSH